jgi:hypothetical protein
MTILTSKNKDYPVAFASNTFYAMERNGKRHQGVYEHIIFPILKEKVAHLHSEGIAGTIWALGQLDHVDEDLASVLIAEAQTRKFGPDYEYKQAKHFSTDEFKSAEGLHFDESNYTSDTRELFFEDHLALCDLKEGLEHIAKKEISSDLSNQV